MQSESDQKITEGMTAEISGKTWEYRAREFL